MTRRPKLDDSELDAALRASRALHDAPEHVIQRALAVFTAQPAPPAAQGALRRLAAWLAFDSGAGGMPLAFGMRGGGDSVRQMLFSAEGHDVDLRIAPAERAGGFALSGQVLGPDGRGAVLVEPESGGVPIQTELNELGEFRLPALDAGRYRITLKLASVAIELPIQPLPPQA